MAEDEEQPRDSQLPYTDWMEEALRLVVVRALTYAAEHGLPGEHHFYLTFRTDHPATIIPPRLKAQYPQVMTIVLQHQFWGLKADQETGLINVGLSFGGVPASLVIPIAAVTSFADPHVQYGLHFRAVELPQAAAADSAAAEPTIVAPASTADSAAAADAAPDAASTPAAEPQVVSLDAFRRRPPGKT